MKKIFFAFLFAALFAAISVLVGDTRAYAADIDDYVEPDEGAVLCMPDVYETAPNDCLPLGPSITLKEMKENGVQLPYESLVYDAPAYELTFVPYLYGQVANPGAPMFTSKEAAAAGRPVFRRMEVGFTYVSYSYTEVYNDVRVYMVEPGIWMNANDVKRIGTPNFQGILPTKVPRRGFGWILQTIETKSTPGYQVNDYTGKWAYRYETLKVLGKEQVGNTLWLQIRPGEWIEERFMGRVTPRSTPPDGVTGDRWIDVNLYEQTIAVYENGKIVFATLISSGVDPFWTRPGTFQVYDMLETTPMSGAFEADRSDYYYLQDVPWTLYFDEARAIHGAYWHTFYGYERSHGCVNMSPGDARWLFNWAQVGDWVHVWDPSGRTPEDPSLYGSGGA